MKTKIIQQSVTVTKKETKDVTVYVASDDKEFKTEKECLEYEETLSIIKKGELIFHKLNLEYEYLQYVIESLGGCGDITDVKLFLFNATKDESIISDAIKYLFFMIPKNTTYKEDLFSLNEGQLYAIASWTENYHTDYPKYESEIMSVEEINKHFELLTTNIKQKLQIIK
jgi:hypothetical protein